MPAQIPHGCARKALQRLIDAGLVTRKGQGKRTRYMPSEEADED